MTPQEKIARLFQELTMRYGVPEVREGQSRKAVSESWAMSVGRYSMNDIMAALRMWSQQTKYAKWPEEGQFLELLRSFMAAPDKSASEPATLSMQEAEKAAGAWYRNEIIGRHAGSGWYPHTFEECLVGMLQRRKLAFKPETFAQMLTRAFLEGVLPAQWKAYKAAWIENAQVRTKEWHAANQAHGPLYANTMERKR